MEKEFVTQLKAKDYLNTGYLDKTKLKEAFEETFKKIKYHQGEQKAYINNESLGIIASIL